MTTNKQQSSVNAMTGVITFSDEPLRYRRSIIQLVLKLELYLKRKNRKNDRKNKKRGRC